MKMQKTFSMVVWILLFSSIALIPLSIRGAEPDSTAMLEFLEYNLKDNSKDFSLFLQRGRHRLERGDYKNAEADFRRVLNSKSDSLRSLAHVGIGDVIRRRMVGHGTQAALEYKLACELDRRNCEALFKRAEVGFSINDADGWDMASSALTRLVCIDPDYRDALNIWLHRFVRHSDYELRLVNDSLNALAGRDSSAVRWQVYVGRNWYLLGETDSALTALDRAANSAPGFQPTLRELIRARCLVALDDTLGFEQAYEKALEAAANVEDFLVLAEEAAAIFTVGETERWKKVKTTGEAADFLRTFWKRRDPDPLTPYNERRVTHYWRLAEAQHYYSQNKPHSFYYNTPNGLRMAGIAGTDYEYKPEMFFQRNRGLGLNQQGHLYVRHGPPDRIDRAEGSPIPDEWAWWYGSTFFAFKIKTVKEYGGPNDPFFMPIYVRGAGNMTKAMQTESFTDPLPVYAQNFLGVDFRALDGKLELLYFQSATLDSVRSFNALFSDLALYDSTWIEVGRNTAVSWRVDIPGDSLWLAVNQMVVPPGKYNYALRMDIPGRRAVRRNAMKLDAYPEKGLELSGMVLGSRPASGAGVFHRAGVEIHPRPSLRFRHGEKIAVYLEVYGLAVKDGRREFEERVTVTRDEKKSLLARVLPFRDPKLDQSLSMIFERSPEHRRPDVPENFEIDTSNLMPGHYSLVVEVRDNTGQSRRRGLEFDIVTDQ